MRRVVMWVQFETQWTARDKWGDVVTSKREASKLWRQRMAAMMDASDPDVRRRMPTEAKREEMRRWLQRRKLMRLVEVRPDEVVRRRHG